MGGIWGREPAREQSRIWQSFERMGKEGTANGRGSFKNISKILI